MSASWQTLGTTLREARAHKGVTLAEAQQATKVRQAFLAALEEDDYSTLPPTVYVRGFIKNYATYLGLDSQICIQSFDEMVEAAAAGYEPYYGSSDSGGKGIHPAERSQLLSGLSQGEARLMERGPQSLNAQPLPVAKPLEDNETAATLEADQPTQEYTRNEPNAAIEDAPVKVEGKIPPHAPAGLRPYEKYVLRPAIQPISKPSLYIPNFVPFILVLVIAGAALLLLYRGLVMPKTNDISNPATPTVNVLSAATVTPLVNGNIFEGNATNSITATITRASSVMLPPPFFTPINTPTAINTTPAVVVNPVQPVAVVAPGSANNVNTATAVPIPATATALRTTVPPTPIPAGPTPTPTPDPNATVTVEVNVISVSQTSSWLGVTVDGESKYAKFFTYGDAPLIFTGKQVEVRAGAPGVVLIKVNGVSKPYTTPNSGIVTHIFRADGTDSIVK